MTALQYARVAWSRGVYTSLREVLSAMKEGRYVEMRLINRIMSEILNKTEIAMEQIGKTAYGRVMSSATPNLFGLNEMLKERLQYYSERLDDYKYLIKKFDNPSIFIGRRGQDIVRELSLETLEEGFLKGNPTAFTETKLVDRILNSPKAVKFVDRATAETAMKQFHSTVVDKIPLFHEDGEAKFMLQVRSGGEDGEYRGKFQAWSAEKYADLVAITTAAEADAMANLDLAREIGTRIVKWNSTGKGVEFYLRIGDIRCARVDGQYASLEPEGTTINGVYYPYYKSKERLPGRFNICHPNCRHRLTPVPEEVLGGVSKMQVVTSDDLLRNLSEDERSQAIKNARVRIIKDKSLLTSSISYRPATTITAAQDEAKSYGVKIAEFGSEKNLKIAQMVNQVLRDLVQNNKPVPERIVVNDELFARIFGHYSNEYHAAFERVHEDNSFSTIWINSKSDMWKNPASYMKYRYALREYSSSSIYHAIHHEIGHFLHNYKLGNKTYQFFKDTVLTNTQKNLIRTQVSEYATDNPLEFVAEVYAGIQAGIKYSDEIMRIYARFGGV